MKKATPFGSLLGDVQVLKITSELLKNNPLGDPVDRLCPVYVPPNFEEISKTQKLPLLVDLAPYTNSGLGRTAWQNFSKSIPEIIDAMIDSGELLPCVVAFPDGFTKLGGNQYINSSAIGPYEDYIKTEVVPQVESALSCGGPRKRGVYGKSSGGYAALVYALTQGIESDSKTEPFWSGIACHSGDIGFDLAYLYDMPSVLMAYEKYGFDSKTFLENFWQKQERLDPVKGADIHLLMMLAMSASYHPEACNMSQLQIPLPVDPHTMVVNEKAFSNWKRFDPLEMVASHSKALKDLSYLYIDCGAQDQYRLQYGSRCFVKILTEKGVEHTYQEFLGTHSGINHRLKQSLPGLVKALMK